MIFDKTKAPFEHMDKGRLIFLGNY